MSFLVAGWSASLGHDRNQQWMNGNFGGVGFFGLSGIGIGFPGGPSGGVPVPYLYLFGGMGIQTGWNLSPVPEPSSACIAALGLLTLMLYRTRLTMKPNPGLHWTAR
jgi:hypothetical protein